MAAAPSPPAPRSRLPRAQRERQILDVAHALFAHRGYAALTMDEVAAEVGVTKPLLYAYFGNKERLYVACLQRAGDALIDAVTRAIATAPDTAHALRAGVHAFFAFLDAERDAWRVLFDETVPAGGEVANRVAEYRRRLTRLVADARMADVAPARRPAAAPRVQAAATALLGAAEALGHWWLQTGAMSAAQAADVLVASFEPGLRPPAARPRSTPTGGSA